MNVDNLNISNLGVIGKKDKSNQTVKITKIINVSSDSIKRAPLHDLINKSKEEPTLSPASIESTLSLPAPKPSSSGTSLESLNRAQESLSEAKSKNVNPEAANFAKKNIIKHLKQGKARMAAKQAYESLPAGVLPKVVTAALGAIGFIGGTVACVATGGAVPLIIGTVCAGATAIMGACDALRAYKTRANKSKPFSNDSVGYLINKVLGGEHKKVANAASSGLRICLFIGATLSFVANSASAAGGAAGGATAHSTSGTAAASASAPHWTHTAEGVSVVGEAFLNKYEAQDAETVYNINGHSGAHDNKA